MISFRKNSISASRSFTFATQTFAIIIYKIYLGTNYFFLLKQWHLVWIRVDIPAQINSLSLPLENTLTRTQIDELYLLLSVIEQYCFNSIYYFQQLYGPRASKERLHTIVVQFYYDINTLCFDLLKILINNVQSNVYMIAISYRHV